MKDKIYYVVENTDMGYPQYLDGFRDGQPVWKSGLQNIDPFIRIETALAESKKCSGGFVRSMIIDDNGRHQLCRTP